MNSILSFYSGKMIAPTRNISSKVEEKHGEKVDWLVPLKEFEISRALLENDKFYYKIDNDTYCDISFEISVSRKGYNEEKKVKWIPIVDDSMNIVLFQLLTKFNVVPQSVYDDWSGKVTISPITFFADCVFTHNKSEIKIEALQGKNYNADVVVQIVGVDKKRRINCTITKMDVRTLRKSA